MTETTKRAIESAIATIHTAIQRQNWDREHIQKSLTASKQIKDLMAESHAIMEKKYLQELADLKHDLTTRTLDTVLVAPVTSR